MHRGAIVPDHEVADALQGLLLVAGELEAERLT